MPRDDVGVTEEGEAESGECATPFRVSSHLLASPYRHDIKSVSTNNTHLANAPLSIATVDVEIALWHVVTSLLDYANFAVT